MLGTIQDDLTKNKGYSFYLIDELELSQQSVVKNYVRRINECDVCDGCDEEVSVTATTRLVSERSL